MNFHHRTRACPPYKKRACFRRPFSLCKYSSYRQYGSVCRIVADLDTVLLAAGVYDSAVAHIDRTVAGITDDIAGLGLRVGYSRPHAAQRAGGMGQAHTEFRIHGHNKSGTIRTVCQAGTAPYIGVAHELGSVADHGASLSAVSHGTAAGRAA